MKYFYAFLVATTFVFSHTQAHQFSRRRTVSNRYLRYAPVTPTTEKTTTKKAPKTWSYVLAAHPDDEVLCCGHTMQKILKNKGNIKVIIFTNGDAHPQNAIQYGETRKQESLKSLQEIGIQKKDVLFLGFPDAGLTKLKPLTPYRSPYTNKTHSGRSADYPNIPYTTNALAKILNNISKKFPAREIFLPSQKDEHPDHQYVGRIGSRIQNQGKQPLFFYYTIHGRTNQQKSIPKLTRRKNHWLKHFQSQFHTPKHKQFYKNLAKLREKFTLQP
ncbi:hypothetical protein CSB37_01585 [bacterium DOLZORAL124_38_8]|nr:MAG: hypothetical protein CSB37_01585 [bacterium DOLZORAL124_38_8]